MPCLRAVLASDPRRKVALECSKAIVGLKKKIVKRYILNECKSNQAPASKRKDVFVENIMEIVYEQGIALEIPGCAKQAVWVANPKIASILPRDFSPHLLHTTVYRPLTEKRRRPRYRTIFL